MVNVIKTILKHFERDMNKMYVLLFSTANQSPVKKLNNESKQNPSPLSKTTQEKPQYDRPVPGSTLRCLDDPSFPDINSPPSAVSGRTVEVVDKARDRFDRFWGGANEEQK